MKLVLIKNYLYNVAQKNTKVACTYIFRRLMRLRGGMSAITFIDSCGHSCFTYKSAFSDAQRLSCYFILYYFVDEIEQNHAVFVY